ncbi:hypothetical protein Tco_1400257 [Tanacetum coccineum]
MVINRLQKRRVENAIITLGSVSTEDAEEQNSLGLTFYLVPNVKGSTGSSSSAQNVFPLFLLKSTSSRRATNFDFKNQLALTRQKLSASIATKHGILLENSDQKEIKKAEGEMQGTLDIKQKTLGGDLENRRNLKLCRGSYTQKQLGDASIEIQAYTQALKKVEAQLVAHQKNQLWYEEKIRFMKIDLDDKTDVLTYHKKLLAEAEIAKATRRCVGVGKDKFGLGYGKSNTMKGLGGVIKTKFLKGNNMPPEPIEKERGVSIATINNARTNLSIASSHTSTTIKHQTAPKANFTNHKVNTAGDKTVSAVRGYRETAVKASAVFHSKIKHIEIRHHFIRDAYEKKLIQVLKIHTDDNVADLLTKAFDVSRKKVPLTKETLERMLALRLIVESESEAVFDLLRFIQKQIDESKSHDRSDNDL